jgi:galacturan 1,4-alpha-galacturonidase
VWVRGVVWRSPRLTLSSKADPIAEIYQLAKMRFQLLISLLAALATLTSAVPTLQAFEQWLKGPQGQKTPEHTSPRPSIACHPKHPGRPLPRPPPRKRVCYVRSHNDGVTDDSSYILDALHSCNNGGHVVFSEGVEYFIATALDLTFLEHIDLGMKIGAAPMLKN